MRLNFGLHVLDGVADTAAACLRLVLAATIIGTSCASSYYRPNFSDPRLKNPQFHESARDVLDNLKNFKALYVKYENCAWAYYGQPYAERRGDGGGDGGDGGSFLGCGGKDGGDEYWYMGRTACFRAQAAYSLYGIPKGHSGSIGSKCRKATYINSFFTALGVEAFATPLGVDTTYGNSYCTAHDSGGAAAAYDDDANANGYHNDKYNLAGYTSTGTGCQRKRFVKDTYTGASCDGNDYVETTDTLDSFNKALDNLGCVQIYDSSSGYVYANGDDDGDGEDHQDEDNNAVDFTALENSVEILKYSITCDVDQYPESCPDPHGLLRSYRAKLQSALGKAASNDIKKSAKELAMNAFTGIFYIAALLLGAIAIRKFWRLHRLSSKSGLKKNQKSTTPSPSSADEGPTDAEPETRQPSVASSVATSVASSVHNIQTAIENVRTASMMKKKEEVVDEDAGTHGVVELPYQPPKVDNDEVPVQKLPPKDSNSVQATDTIAATAAAAGEPAPQNETAGKAPKHKSFFGRFRKEKN